MKAIVQRVLRANLKVDGKVISNIDKGLVVFFGVGQGDSEQMAEKLIKKIVKLRIFEDEDEKMNLSIKEIGGEVLFVSQFTLFANCKGQNRPSFIEAEKPERANELYEYGKKVLANEGVNAKYGIFGADMKIEALNDGPVTIILDTKDI